MRIPLRVPLFSNICCLLCAVLLFSPDFYAHFSFLHNKTNLCVHNQSQHRRSLSMQQKQRKERNPTTPPHLTVCCVPTHLLQHILHSGSITPLWCFSFAQKVVRICAKPNTFAPFCKQSVKRRQANRILCSLHHFPVLCKVHLCCVLPRLAVGCFLPAFVGI